nr:hypothetical protein [Tanacetum cinerariifolium]
MSVKRTSWNEFSSAMASAVICLSTGDLSTHSTKYISPALTQKVFANMRRVGKGCSGIETPLFEGTLVAKEPEEQGAANNQPIPSPTPLTPPSQQPQDVPSTSHAQSPLLQPHFLTPAQTQGAYFPMSLLHEALDACAALARRVEHLEHDKADIYHIDMDHAAKVLSMQEDESEVQKAVEVVITAKLITKVVAAISETVSVAAIIPSAIPETISAAAIPTVTTPSIKVDAPVKATVPFTRQKREVVIRDPEEESSAKTPTKTTSKDKGKGILVEEPKPMKKKQQVELDEAYARKLREEFNQDIDWEAAIDHVKQRAKEEPFIQRYQKIEEEESRTIATINETPAHKATKRRKLIEEAKEAESIKQHLQIVPDKDDDVFTEATPLARKVPVVDYKVILVNNKPRYKIIKADDTHQLYASFITMLKIFDREDLDTLWRIVKKRFSASKPKNFSDEYLLTTLKTMFERPDRQDNEMKDKPWVSEEKPWVLACISGESQRYSLGEKHVFYGTKKRYSSGEKPVFYGIHKGIPQVKNMYSAGFIKRYFEKEKKSESEMIHHHFHHQWHQVEAIGKDDFEWWRRRTRS